MNFTLPVIYPITDTRLSGLSHAEQVRLMIAGGARLIQLREKHATPRQFYESARAAVLIAREHGAVIVINDRVDIALVLGGGVHLGQDDLPPERAREILGPDAIIGYSTHSVEQAVRAAELPVDYIAIGPVFETHTKQDPDAVVGLDAVRLVREAIGTLPLVAIGGIGRDNLTSVLAAGADSAAIIASIAGSDDIESEMRSLSATARPFP